MRTEIKAMLQVFVMVSPGPEAKRVISANARTRGIPLTKLSAPKGICVWCNESDIIAPRKRYCSDACCESAKITMWPQGPASKAWILINRQSCGCAWCGQDYTEHLEERVLRLKQYHEGLYAQYPDWYPAGPPKHVSYFSLGSETGTIWEVDHRTPIHKGGHGTDPTNIQVICTSCHRTKTILERRPACPPSNE